MLELFCGIPFTYKAWENNSFIFMYELKMTLLVLNTTPLSFGMLEVKTQTLITIYHGKIFINLTIA